MFLFGGYMAATPGVRLTDNATLRLAGQNEVQPDAALFVDPDLGGRTTVSDDDYLEGGPEFVAEISASSVSIDLNQKFLVYQQNGVSEYLVWRVVDEAIDWFTLKDSKYEQIAPDEEGRLRSGVFPGLWVDAQALTRSDVAAAFAVLQQGVASPEHRAFVELLATKSKSGRL
jgi:hypothetical protein